MEKKLARKKILGIILIFLVVLVFVFLNFFPNTKPIVQNIYVSDITSSSATLLWQSSKPTFTNLKFAKKSENNFEVIKKDKSDGEKSAKRYIHVVEIPNLQAENIYSIFIEGEEKEINFQTKKLKDPAKPESGFGKIIDFPSETALIFKYVDELTEENTNVSVTDLDEGKYSLDLTLFPANVSAKGLSVDILYKDQIFSDFNFTFDSVKPFENIRLNPTKKLSFLEKIGIKAQDDIYKGVRGMYPGSVEFLGKSCSNSRDINIKTYGQCLISCSQTKEFIPTCESGCNTYCNGGADKWPTGDALSSSVTGCTSEQFTVSSTKNLNIRSDKSTTSRILGLLKPGNLIIACKSDNPLWLSINFEGKNAFIYESLTRVENPPASGQVTIDGNNSVGNQVANTGSNGSSGSSSSSNTNSSSSSNTNSSSSGSSTSSSNTTTDSVITEIPEGITTGVGYKLTTGSVNDFVNINERYTAIDRLSAKNSYCSITNANFYYSLPQDTNFYQLGLWKDEFNRPEISDLPNINVVKRAIIVSDTDVANEFVLSKKNSGGKYLYLLNLENFSVSDLTIFGNISFGVSGFRLVSSGNVETNIGANTSSYTIIGFNDDARLSIATVASIEPNELARKAKDEFGLTNALALDGGKSAHFYDVKNNEVYNPGVTDGSITPLTYFVGVKCNSATTYPVRTTTAVPLVVAERSVGSSVSIEGFTLDTNKSDPDVGYYIYDTNSEGSWGKNSSVLFPTASTFKQIVAFMYADVLGKAKFDLQAGYSGSDLYQMVVSSNNSSTERIMVEIHTHLQSNTSQKEITERTFDPDNYKNPVELFNIYVNNVLRIEDLNLGRWQYIKNVDVSLRRDASYSGRKVDGIDVNNVSTPQANAIFMKKILQFKDKDLVKNLITLLSKRKNDTYTTLLEAVFSDTYGKYGFIPQSDSFSMDTYSDVAVVEGRYIVAWMTKNKNQSDAKSSLCEFFSASECHLNLHTQNLDILRRVKAVDLPPTPTEIDFDKLSTGEYELEISGYENVSVKKLTEKLEVTFFQDKNANGVKDPDESTVEKEKLTIKLKKLKDLKIYQLEEGWNLVSFPMNTEFKTAKDIVENFSKNGVNLLQVSKYQNGKWIDFVRLNSGNAYEEYGSNFGISPLEGYFIKSINSGNVLVEGNAIEESAIKIKLNAGWNLVNWPLPKKSTATAFLEKCNLKVSTCSSIYAYQNGGYEGIEVYSGELFGLDFDLESQSGYFVKNNGSGEVWLEI